MRFFKNETGGNLYLYAVNDDSRTISKLQWDSNDAIFYDPDYGYSHLSQVEGYDAINEAGYFTFTDAINSAFRIGTHPVKPPGS